MLPISRERIIFCHGLQLESVLCVLYHQSSLLSRWKIFHEICLLNGSRNDSDFPSRRSCSVIALAHVVGGGKLFSFLLWHMRIHKNFKWETKSSKDFLCWRRLCCENAFFFFQKRNILMSKRREWKKLNNRKSDGRKFPFYVFVCDHCGEILRWLNNKQRNFHCHVSLDCKPKLGHETVEY